MAKDLDLGNATSYSYYVSEGGTKTPQEFGEMLVNIDTVASRAEESASDAEESATSANESKESAIGAKDIAIAKANEASASADVALNKAGEASASATVASNKANEASASATTASAKATESSQNALTAVGAKNDAVSAKNDAVTAKTQAVSAKDDAVTAKLGAESARDQVQSSASQIAQNASDISELKEDLKSTNVAVFADGENIINSKKTHYNNNTALVNNNDGTYTVGTSDYGKTLFSGRLTLDPGVYYLYGVPNGYSFLSHDGNLSTAFVKNYTSNGVPVLITETTVCFIGFCLESAPSASFTIAPYLKKDYISRLTSIVERNGKINNNANILNNDDVTYTPNKYYANGSYYINTDYSLFEINLKEGMTYVFGCKMRFFYDASGSIASSTAEGYSYTPDADKKVYASVFNTDSDKWIVVISPDLVSNALPYGSIGLNPAVFANETGNSLLKTMSQKAITDAIKGASTLPYYEQYRGNEQSYTLGTANSIKKNKVINFGCDFSTFGTLYIDLIFGTGNSIENRFAIDSTNLVRTVDGSVKPAVAHGITIKDHINVTIEILITGIKLIIASNGQTFSTEYNYASGSVRPSYSVSGMSISNVDFSWTCKDFKKDLWLFGDSYFSYGDNRWIYYLNADGYASNCLIDAYPGENSQYSLPSLQRYINIAKPQNIVWCVGMNDGGDSSSAPSAQWKNALDTVISICEDKGINLILATIPTVPSINHEKKNEFVRSSGYQYIDFAKAVGASSSGVWFDGMLATDNVHPTAAGAMALYRQALLDCPQLMISN